MVRSSTVGESWAIRVGPMASESDDKSPRPNTRFRVNSSLLILWFISKKKKKTFTDREKGKRL